MDLRWQSLIALLHFYLVSTTIWIEGGQGCMGSLQWLSSRSRVQADYRTSDDGNILYCINSMYFLIWILGAGQPKREGEASFWMILTTFDILEPALSTIYPI